jgi:hypothetical protein
VTPRRQRSAKAERLAPAIEAALACQQHLPTPDEIPSVPAYGHFSHLPTAEDYEVERSLQERGTSAETAGALGLR